MIDDLKVALAPERVSSRPGETAEVEVTVRNASQTVEHYSASVVGLPRGARYTCEPAVAQLMPDQTAAIRVRISLPERGAEAGVHTLGMLVRSPYRGDVSRCEEFALDVVAVPALTMTAHPQVVVGGWAGKYALSINNNGNVPLCVGLTCSDPEDAVLFAFRPRDPTVAPGASTRVRLSVRATRPWTGAPVTRSLKLAAAADPDLTVDQAVTFVQRPQLPSGLLRLAAMALGILVLAAAVIGGALLVRDGRQKTPADRGSDVAAPAAPAPTGQARATGPSPAARSTSGPSGTGPGGSPGTGQAAGGKATVVDFTSLPGGEPAGDRIIPANLYAEAGVTLSTVTELAPPGCQDATALALRTHQSLGSFLTSSRPASVDLCNTQPVRMKLATPARQVRLTFGGLGAQYRATLELSDGTTQSVAAASQQGAVSTLSYDAPARLSVVSVVFGHANPDPTAKDPTIIKRLTFTPTG
jgi:hypothetical protein